MLSQRLTGYGKVIIQPVTTGSGQRLQRVRIGPLKIRNMEPGDWRELSEEEVRQLKRPLKNAVSRE